MKRQIVLGLVLCGSAAAGAADQVDPLTQPWTCDNCARWNEAVAPFRIVGNTYYVGVRGLASVLVATSQGLILVDGDLPQSAPLIEANIRALGFKVEDIRLILASHGHPDHVGGIAALQRDSGARVSASPATAQVLQHGQVAADDPQAQWLAGARIPALLVPPQVVRNGEALSLGEVTVTAHFTPGHTPGATAWSWKSCEAGHCLDVVYADSLNAVAPTGFRYSGGADHADLTPRFRHSIATLAALPCDVIVTVHPEQGQLWDKLAARLRGVKPDPFVAPESCRLYASAAQKLLDERVAHERGGR